MPAAAFDWKAEAYVTGLEPTYMPGWIAFQVDAPAGTCAAGAWLNYTAQGRTKTAKQANSAAAFNVLLAAQTAHKRVRLFGFNSGSSITNPRLIHGDSEWRRSNNTGEGEQGNKA